jgi:hypothetical protein
MNLHTAGNDLTNDILNRSPHGIKKLERALKVGTLVFWNVPEGFTKKEKSIVFKNNLRVGYLIR